MFLGNIDFASRTHVEGWVYCARLSLVGARVHAFVDDHCVGTGIVDLYRQDLVEAGVGDGLGGFSFSISLDPSEDPRMLHIRVEDGNALIRQPASRLASRQQIASAIRARALDPEAVSWMRARAWLTQAQHDTLQTLIAYGVCKQSLHAPVTNAGDAKTWHELVVEMLEVFMFARVMPRVLTELTLVEFTKQRHNLCTDFPAAAPIIGLWSRQKNCLNVVEGSHLNPLSDDGARGGIEYEFGDDEMLWINVDCQLSVPIGGANAAVTAIIPSRPDRPSQRAALESVVREAQPSRL
jgi:hypothetical protein